MRCSIARAVSCASLFLPLSFSFLAQAAPDGVSTLPPVVVTASRTPQSVVDTLPATTVITREDIADSGAVDVAGLLRGQAGVDIAQTGGLGSQTSLFLRGSNSNQVLVLVDGMRVNAVGSGAASLAHIMVDQIDHIEIVRGNVSSLYGSEAIGGVVQIFTRGGSGEGSRLAANGSYGSERTRAASIEGNQSFGSSDARTRIGVAASYRSANGFSAIDADRVAAANPDFDGYRNTSVSAHLSQQFGAHEVGIRYVESRGHLQFDETTDYSFIDPAYDGRIQTHEERSRQNDGLVYARLAAASFWTIDLQAGQTRDLSVNSSSNPFSFVAGATTSTDRQYRFANTLRLSGHTLTGAYEHLDQTGFSTSYGNGVDGATFSRHVDSVMLGYLGPMFLSSSVNEFQFNLRHDDYSDFGLATTGLAAYGLKFAAGWKAIVQASTAFKAPAFNELYFPFFGNPDLKAERARNVEIGLQYAADATLVRVSAFRVRTHDLIVYDPMLFLANNVDRAKVTGVELTARTVIDGWKLSADLTFARPIDEGTRQVLLRRTTRNARVAVAKSFGPWRVSGDVSTAGRRFDSDIDTFARTTLGGYAVTNLGVRYALSKFVDVGAEVTNAFDRRYALVDGYNVPGRVALLSVGLTY